MKLWMTSVVVMIAASAVNAAMDEKSIRERTAPVAKVCLEGQECGSASASSGPKSPEDIFNGSCAGCHSTGALNAPKVGDAAAWAPRIAQGLDTLVGHAISGLNSMPPKGTCAACTDEEIRAVVEYMTEKSK